MMLHVLNEERNEQLSVEIEREYLSEKHCMNCNQCKYCDLIEINCPIILNRYGLCDIKDFNEKEFDAPTYFFTSGLFWKKS